MRHRYAAVLAAGAALAAAQPAAAHAYLQSSMPAGGSTSETPPTQVTITFTEALEPSFAKVEVRNAAGQAVTAGPAALASGGATVLTVPLKPLKPGAYKVTWHVTSTDTHKTSGSFGFDVAAPD